MADICTASQPAQYGRVHYCWLRSGHNGDHVCPPGGGADHTTEHYTWPSKPSKPKRKFHGSSSGILYDQDGYRVGWVSDPSDSFLIGDAMNDA